MSLNTVRGVVLLLLLACAAASSNAQTLQQGPFKRLVIRGVTIIDGTGGPAYGPADVVVEADRITEIRIVGDPRAGINPAFPIDPSNT